MRVAWRRAVAANDIIRRGVAGSGSSSCSFSCCGSRFGFCSRSPPCASCGAAQVVTAAAALGERCRPFEGGSHDASFAQACMRCCLPLPLGPSLSLPRLDPHMSAASDRLPEPQAGSSGAVRVRRAYACCQARRDAPRPRCQARRSTRLARRGYPLATVVYVRTAGEGRSLAAAGQETEGERHRGPAAHGTAARLVRAGAGLPAVLDWFASDSDGAATDGRWGDLLKTTGDQHCPMHGVACMALYVDVTSYSSVSIETP